MVMNTSTDNPIKITPVHAAIPRPVNVPPAPAAVPQPMMQRPVTPAQPMINTPVTPAPVMSAPMMPVSEPVIKLENVRKVYGSHLVLKGVNMQVNRGDIYGLIGKNGAGKTTIFKMILGLSGMNAGKVSITGSRNKNQLQKNRSKIGFLVGTRFFGYLPARENLKYFAAVKGIPGRYVNREIDRVLSIVGLDKEKKPFKSYSMGMKQRLGIANAILGSPEILILDEPTNGLDPQGIADVRHMIKCCRDEFGMTVIVSSHILGELENTADRFGILNDGILVREITQDDLKIKRSTVEISVDDLPKARELLTAGGVNILRVAEEKATFEDFYFHLIGGEDLE